MEGITLGKVRGSFWKREKLTDDQLNHHVHVVGASGYGKTVLLMHILRHRILNGHGVMFVDLKGDRETLKELRDVVQAAGRIDDVKVFSLNPDVSSTQYNLVLNGTATQLRDRIMLSLSWSEEYYKNQSASFLLKLLIGLCWLRDNRDEPFDLSVILAASKTTDFYKEKLKVISDVGVAQIFDEALRFIKDEENYRSIQGLRTQLESLVLSDFGSKLMFGENSIDLFKAATQCKIVFAFLDSRRYGESSRAVGKFILQDLKYTSSRIDSEVNKIDRRPFTVIVDEFSDLAQEDFIGFLDRARSSRMSIVVAHQEICDLMRISPEFAGRLMRNTSTLYAFLQKRPESAEVISGMAGTRTAWKITRQTKRVWLFEVDSGQASKRGVEEFIIHPNQIKNLRVGECVVIKKYPKATADLVVVNYSGPNITKCSMDKLS